MAEAFDVREMPGQHEGYGALLTGLERKWYAQRGIERFARSTFAGVFARLQAGDDFIA